MRIIGIDPGNIESAYCILDNGSISETAKLPNGSFWETVSEFTSEPCVVYLEDIQAMGMSVGQEVFDTAKQIGRLQLLMEQSGVEYVMIKRTEVKLHHCNTTRAKDTNIRAALIERFGDKGTKSNKGFFFGVSGSDQWSACAIALAGNDKTNGR